MMTSPLNRPTCRSCIYRVLGEQDRAMCLRANQPTVDARLAHPVIALVLNRCGVNGRHFVPNGRVF